MECMLFHMDQNTPSAMTEGNAFAASIAGGVREAMTSGGTTHRELSEKSGIPLATLHRRLTATTPFTLTELKAVSIVLGLDVSDLLRQSETPAASGAVA